MIQITNEYRNFFGKTLGKRPLGRLGLIFEIILIKYCVKMYSSFIWNITVSKHGNKHSPSMK